MLLGLSPFVTSWIQKNNKDKSLKHLHPFLPALSKLLDKFVQRSVDFVREKIKEIVPTPDANLVFSLLKMLECFFSPFIIVEGQFCYCYYFYYYVLEHLCRQGGASCYVKQHKQL